jgi:hypothetical protein
MDLTWGIGVSDLWDAILAALPWIIGVLSAATLLVWMLAAAFTFRACRRLAGRRRKAVALPRAEPQLARGPATAPASGIERCYSCLQPR